MSDKALILDRPTRDLFANVMAKEWCATFVLTHGQFDVVIDVGAHCGLYSILARTYNPQATIIALEPGTESFEALKKNIEGLNIETHLIALGHGGSGTMSKHSSSVRNKFVEASVGDGIPSMRLSDLIEKFYGSIANKRLCIKVNYLRQSRRLVG